MVLRKNRAIEVRKMQKPILAKEEIIVFYLQVANAVYDCAACGMVHTYHDGEIYELHQDLMIGVKRWVYQRVTI